MPPDDTVGIIIHQVTRFSLFAGLVLLGPTLLLVLVASQKAKAWKRWYLTALVAGTIIGALAGAFCAFACMAAAGGVPEPWRDRIIPVGAVVGGATVAATFVIAVGLVHGVVALMGCLAGRDTAEGINSGPPQ